MKSSAFVLTMLLCLSFYSNAQRNISGTLTDEETGEFLIGANIIVTGTSSGAVSDLDGNYAVVVPQGYSQLTFSYTGYTSQTIDIGNSDRIDLTMSPGSILDEVVVIGYGTVKKEDATGSVQSITSEDFNEGAISSPQELLVGKVSGVQITTNSGSPGDGAVIRIRGGSSLSASNDPLIVIDGVPISNGGVSGGRNPLNLINPNDIESFTVLKDASATAIYGSRASNGVIIITSKKGALGNKLKINYNGNVSFSERIGEINVFSADAFKAKIEEVFPEGHPARNVLGDANTDWQDQIFEAGIGTDQNVNLSGGIGNFLPYRISGGYTNKKGILKTDQFRRLTGAINLSPGFFDNTLQLKVNVKAVKINNNFANRGAIGSAVSFDPTQPLLDAESPYGGYFTWTDETTGFPNGLAPANPLALLELRDDQSEVTGMISSLSVDYRLPFFKDLRANLNVAHDVSNGGGSTKIPGTASFAFDAQTGGGVDNEYDAENKNQLLEFYLNYTKSVGKTKVDLLGGYSWQRFFFSSNFRSSNLAGTPSETVTGEDSAELYLLSLYGRLNVTLFDNLLLTATLRRDGSSRFSPENRWGLFPAAAVAYKILNDQPGMLNNLKLRLGYGITGQQEIGGFYVYQSRYLSSFSNAQYQFGDEFVQTLRPEGYDANIKWEETTTYNAAVDFGMFNDRLSGSVEYYIRNTDDLLNFIRVPAGTNLTNFISTNVGSLQNKGVEVSLNATPISKEKFTWDVGVNMTANKNEITKLNQTDDPDYLGVLTGGISGGVGNTIQIHSVGFPANSYFVFEQVYGEDGRPIQGLYVDRNGDGVVNSEDQYRFQKPAPDLFFGLNTNLNIGNLTLAASGRASIGNYIYNNVQSDQAFTSRLFHPTFYLVNGSTDVNDIGFQNPEYLSDHFIQDGSFFRLDFVSASYKLNKLLGEGKDVTLSATVQNPLLITNYSGVDPEIFSGIDGNIYPRTRTVVFGLNANF